MKASIVQSAITGVKVFRVGATVTREAIVESENGCFPDTVQVPGLPLCLDDNSVSVRIKTEGHGAPSATDVRVGLDVPEVDPSLAPPENADIREARDRVALLEDRLLQCANALKRFEMLDSPVRPAGKRGNPPPPSPTAARIVLLDFRHAQIDRLGADNTALKRELGDSRKHLEMLEQHQQNATNERNVRQHELRKSLTISLAGTKESGPHSCRIVVEYQVPGARWAPSYVVKFSKNFERSEFYLRALICQATGEDWNGVDLDVSSADTQSWTELPDLPSLRIGRAQPLPARTGWREPPTGAENLFADYDRCMKSMPLPAAPRRDEALASHIDFEDIDDDNDDDFDETPLMECLAGSDEELDRACPAPAGAMPPPSVVAASIAPLMAKEVMAKSRKKSGRREDQARKPVKRPMSPAEPTPESAAELLASADIMDYRRLRFPGTSKKERSVLRPASQRELYLESLTSVNINLNISANIDVITTIESARSTANRVSNASPPPNSVFAASWDGFDYRWHAETKIDIPSDGNFHNTPLLARTGESTLSYVIVPSEGPEAYRYVTLNNPLETPLPEGPADIYMDNDFLLTSHIHTVAPGGSVELGLGVEEAIKTARNVSFTEHNKGLLNAVLELEHSIVVDVANRMANEASVEIRERIPLSREGDESIAVDLVAVDPPWQEFRQKMRLIEGAYQWKQSMPPGTNQQFRATYSITISAKNELVGGNRRER